MNKKRKYECPNFGCKKVFKDGLNKKNFNHHLSTCKFQKKKEKGMIHSFFSTKSQTGNVIEKNNYPSTINEYINPVNEFNLNINTETAVRVCKGFRIDKTKGSVLSNYPFHRYDSNNSDSTTIVPFNVMLKNSKESTILSLRAPSCNGYIPELDNEDVRKVSCHEQITGNCEFGNTQGKHEAGHALLYSNKAALSKFERKVSKGEAYEIKSCSKEY